MGKVTGLLLLLVGCLFVCCLSEEDSYKRHYDYIVIGAGPAGLQMGFHLRKANRDYVILERNQIPGSFFATYPRHDMLISINKRYTGKSNVEFNLRHDWNSLLSDDPSLLFPHYSKEFFPHREVMVKYLRDYKEKLHLNVRFDADVRNVRRTFDEARGHHVFQMEDQMNNTFSCRYLLVATGIWKPFIPDIPGGEYIEGYEDIPIDAESFEGQSVMILGRGNAAFEVADRIYGSTNVIHMVARSRVRLSWATHYVGDLRAVNNGLLDTYQLKSLDGVLEADVSEVAVVKTKEGKLTLELNHAFGADNETESDLFDNFALREPYDRIIRCLGWEFDPSIFINGTKLTRGRGRRRKYPKIHHNYESVDFPDLYIAGTLSHSLDFRKSAGGFLHGFRYTARALHRLLEWKNHQVKWPSSSGSTSDLLTFTLKRINEASGIYQMFSMLGDVIILKNDRKDFIYLEEFPIHLIHTLQEASGHEAKEVIVVSLEYGTNFSGAGHDIFRSDRATGEPSEAHTSNFLHPVFYFYDSLPTAEDMKAVPSHENLPRPKRVHHIVEDFLTNWDAPKSHILPFRRFLETIFAEDRRNFFSHSCFELSMTYKELPSSCKNNLHTGQLLEPINDLWQRVQSFDMIV